jgi:hypothetical protein
MPTFERLTSPRVRVRGRRGTSQLIASAYVVSAVCRIDCERNFVCVCERRGCSSDDLRSVDGPEKHVCQSVDGTGPPYTRPSVLATGFGSLILSGRKQYTSNVFHVVGLASMMVLS